MAWIGTLWNILILNPLINILIMLSHYLFGNFGLAIIILTIVVNLIMYPLTLRQLRASKAMQSVQAQVAEIRKKYPKDKQKAAQEQMRLMKESGVSPAGCLLPMLIQMPVWIALYQSVIRLLATAPEGFLDLSQRLYTSWPVFSQLPLQSHFLWLNLATPDFFMAILVGALMWVQQKMTTPVTTDPQQQAQGQMMLWMMPLMFAFLGLSLPSGLAVYWAASTAIRIVLQYFSTGWGGLSFSSFSLRGRLGSNKNEGRARIPRQKKQLTVEDTSADIVIEPGSAREEGIDERNSGSQRQDSGRGHTTGSQSIRRQSGGSKSRRNKRR